MSNYLEETKTVFAERFGLSRHDIAYYERVRCGIPARVLAELDRMAFNLSWVLNGRVKLYSRPVGGQ